MADAPPFDVPQAHRYFSAYCFNAAWELIDKPDRTVEEQLQMLLRAMASLWHWSERPDCTPRSRSIGYWQASRVLALAGYGQMAFDLGRKSLECAADEGPFYVAYAHEAIARAASVLRDKTLYETHWNKARELAASVEDAEEKKMLLDDLESLPHCE